MAKASVFVRARSMPSASAATSLSRTAISARPTRERTVFQAAATRTAVTTSVR